MIKNFLYSLFLHFLLLLAIYANFNLKKPEENKTSEIAVSLIAFDGNNTSSNMNKQSINDEKKKLEQSAQKKEMDEEMKSPKQSPKNEVKEKPKKLAKSKVAKAIKKPSFEEKVQEFKNTNQQEQKEEAQEIRDNNAVSESQDKHQNDMSHEKKDLGADKKSDQEQETNKNNSDAKSNSSETLNSLENMDLSAREKFNIQLQLKRCYHAAIDETKLSSDMKVMIKVQISKDGYIDSDIEDLINMERYNNPAETKYKIAIDNVRRAIDLCSPLRNLPLDKYDIWKEAILEFDESEK